MQKFIKLLLVLVFVPVMAPISFIGFFYAMIKSALSAGVRNWSTFKNWMSNS